MQSQRPVLRQVQKLKMTPQLFQAVRLMALPLQDLKVTIEEELEKNPALQVMEEDTSTVSLDQLPPRESPDAEGEWFDHSSDTGYSRADGDAASDARRQFIEGALSQPGSLQDHLAGSWPSSRSLRSGYGSGSSSSATSTRTVSTMSPWNYSLRKKSTGRSSPGYSS